MHPLVMKDLAEMRADMFIENVYLPEHQEMLREAFIAGAAWARDMLDDEGWFA